MHVDVHRAYCILRIERDIFVELPLEDATMGWPKQREKLAKTMYRTRHAAVACQAEVQKAMGAIGMDAGAYFLCAFRRMGWRSSPRSQRPAFGVGPP